MNINQHFLKLSGSADAPAASLSQHIQNVHAVISTRYPEIDRIALAPYDPSSDELKSFVSSNSDGVRLEHYQAKLKDVPSLLHLAENREIRVVDDIDATFQADSLHTHWLKNRKYRSSLTLPILQGPKLAGFLFFDSKSPSCFDREAVRFLEAFSELVTQQYLTQLKVIHGIEGAVHMARGLAAIRDTETGQHLERVSAYAKLIARTLAEKLQLDDEYIAYVCMFAPLHDIGKIGIPDSILLKKGKLDTDERKAMERHVEIGESIVNQISRNLQMGNCLALTTMQNIVSAHHERGDGKGYPRQLALHDIPLEARIVAVADVYDALSNVRPYKRSWSEEEIVAEFASEVAKGRLDGDCVDALMSAHEQRKEISSKFVDP
jgi:HD-GYP domain-containing protein (c-di-GMP phosphodiesterase class II)